MIHKNLSKKGIHFGIILLFLVILVFVVLLGFWFSESKTHKDNSKSNIFPHTEKRNQESPQLKVDIDLCATIEDDFTCVPKELRKFRLGDRVMLLVKVSNLKSIQDKGGYHLNYQESRRVYSTEGKLIESVSGNILDEIKKTSFEGYLFLPIKNELISSSSDPIGRYKVVVTVSDKNAGIDASKETYFDLIP